jgi:hypothetical protein
MTQVKKASKTLFTEIVIRVAQKYNFQNALQALFTQIGIRVAQKYNFQKALQALFTQIGIRVAQKYNFKFISENISFLYFAYLFSADLCKK